MEAQGPESIKMIRKETARQHYDALPSREQRFKPISRSLLEEFDAVMDTETDTTTASDSITIFSLIKKEGESPSYYNYVKSMNK